MCRLLGLLGNRVLPASRWLVEADASLLAQSHASPETAQKDGWGIGWYEATRVPYIEKGVRGAFEPGEKERFQAIAQRAHGPVVVAHLRSASNPMGLPRSRLLALENSQPFGFESFLFAHNGQVSLPRETLPRLGKFESRVRGVNDSEVLFWLMVKNLEESGDPLRAYVRSREEIRAVWESRQPRTEFPYTGLYVLFTRGPNEIWAFCHWLGEHGTGLLSKDRPYYEMGYQTDTRSLLVGSERFETGATDWQRLRKGEYLHGQIEHGLIGMTHGAIP
ncbi:MAG: class II glutamine amidotransferase [Thermoplasmata archaeon]